MYLMLLFFYWAIFIGLGLIVYGISRGLGQKDFFRKGEYKSYYNFNEGQRLFNEQQRLFDEQQNQLSSEEFMQESLKNVTPFEDGGYDMLNGNSFNDCNNFNNGMF